VDEDEAEDTNVDSAPPVAAADDPSNSLAPLDTLDTADDDKPTGAGQRPSGRGRRLGGQKKPRGGGKKPGETLILPEGDESDEAWTEVELEPGFGSVRVVAMLRGAPTQANVTVDGVPRGPSPLVLAVLPGQHHVKLERVGFGTAEKSILVRAAGEVTLVELEVKSARRR